MPKKPPPLNDEIRDLYQVALAEFTAGRQALAKRLRQAGDPRQSAVRELRKPSLSAWVVNLLFARERRAMAALVGAGERARAAQRRVGKGGDATALRDLVATIRGETERLTGRGVEILTETERAPGGTIVDRLRTNLQSLALDPASATVAERGWLDEDLAPPGFELLAALQVATAPPRPAPRTKAGRAVAAAADAPRKAGDTIHRRGGASGGAVEREQRQERERRERVERARAELAGAESEAEEARREAERSGREADEADEAAAEAARRAQAAQAKARAARRIVGDAEKEAARAEATLARARQALARAERS
jgi:hypothetical protein